MDRVIPTEEQLTALRADDLPVHYLVGTSQARVRQTQAQWKDLPWKQVRDSVRVKLFQEERTLRRGRYPRAGEKGDRHRRAPENPLPRGLVAPVTTRTELGAFYATLHNRLQISVLQIQTRTVTVNFRPTGASGV